MGGDSKEMGGARKSKVKGDRFSQSFNVGWLRSTYTPYMHSYVLTAAHLIPFLAAIAYLS